MPLDGDQKIIQLNKLYNVAASGRAVDAIAPHIEVIGGFVNVYGADTQPGVAPAGMYKTTPDVGMTGIDTFACVPNYLYITQQSGAVTSVVVTGITLTEVA